MRTMHAQARGLKPRNAGERVSLTGCTGCACRRIQDIHATDTELLAGVLTSRLAMLLRRSPPSAT